MTVKKTTYELRATYADGKSVAMATGSIRGLAMHAVYELGRKNRMISEGVLDVVEKELRKHKRAQFDTTVFTIEPIVEEYEEDEDEA